MLTLYFVQRLNKQTGQWEDQIRYDTPEEAQRFIERAMNHKFRARNLRLRTVKRVRKPPDYLA